MGEDSGFGVVDVTADAAPPPPPRSFGGGGKGFGKGGPYGGSRHGQKGGKNGKGNHFVGGKGGKGDFKGGFYGGRKPEWQGRTLASKLPTHRDVKLIEGDVSIGFNWTSVGEGRSPQVIS